MKNFIFYLGSLFLLIFILNAACNNNSSTRSTLESETDSLTVNNEHANNKSITSIKQEQNNTEIIAAKEDENAVGVLATIKTDYLQTQNKLSSGQLRKETKGYDCNDTPGSGSLLRYFEGNDLILIVHQFGSEHYWFSKHIFLKNGEPYFIYEEEGSWGFGGPQNDEKPNTIDKIKENRYYLENGNVIQHLQKSFEEKSWETKQNRDKISNKKISVKKNETYPQAAAIPLWKEGKIKCN